MDGMGWLHTSSPTSLMTGWPGSFQASTRAAEQAALHLARHQRQLAVAADEAPAKSVPPGNVAPPDALTPRALNWSVPQFCASADNGEPVVPSAHGLQSGRADRSTPALRQLVKNANRRQRKVPRRARAKAPERGQSGRSLRRPGCRRKCSRWCRLSRPLIRVPSPSRWSCTSGSARQSCWAGSCSPRRCAGS